MYTAVHYDRFNELMFYWLSDGTRDAKQVKHRFYSPMRGHYGSRPCGMTDIYGREMFESVVSGRDEMNIRQANLGKHNLLAECDIDFRTRWLEDFYKDEEALRIDIDDFNICYLDIEVAVGDRFPTVERADYPINCVTIYFSKYKKYYAFGLNRELKPETEEKLKAHNCEYISCRTESELLTLLFKTIANNNADILTAYNADFFDIPYIVNRAGRLKNPVDLKLLSRLPDKYKSAYISKRDNSLKIGGTEVIDYLKLYKKYKLKERDNFKLDTIGELEVGERKAPLPDGYKSYIKYWDDFVWYNFKDVELMVRIEDKCKLFETTISACAEARVTFDSIFETKKMLVGFILNFLHKKNITMPPLRENTRESFPGAYVYATMGYYQNLVSYDYRSMYPSIIMGANISPETKVVKKDGKFYDSLDNVMDVTEKDLVRSPWDANGAYEVFYRRDIEGIVPQITNIIFGGRTSFKDQMKACKRAGDMDGANVYDMRQKAYKTLGNGFYGLLGNPYFQLYDIDNSASVTCFGYKLINYTIDQLCEYFEGDFGKDQRYFDAFGDYPQLSPDLEGTFLNQDGEECYRRISHGDTDSYFTVCDDIFKDFSEKAGEYVSVHVFDGNKPIHREEYTTNLQRKESFVDFHEQCLKYCPTWKDYPREKKKDALNDGMFTENGYRVIYNRFNLTDYCRIIDAALMEDVLAGYMQSYAEQWNFRENTLFLKREKCISQAIVTAKKKYICNVESDEDIKITEEKDRFKTTGLEIVRSSTTPFARERILTLIKELLANMDKKYIREKYMEIKKEFFKLIEEHNYYPISIPSGIKSEPPKYADYENWPAEDRKKVDWRARSASVWNHLIENDDVLKGMMLEPIHAQAKVKFVKVTPNKFGINSIAYVGDECPEELLTIFNPNWKEQWEKTFAQVMDRMFIAIGWGKNFEQDQSELMMEIF